MFYCHCKKHNLISLLIFTVASNLKESHTCRQSWQTFRASHMGKSNNRYRQNMQIKKNTTLRQIIDNTCTASTRNNYNTISMQFNYYLAWWLILTNMNDLIQTLLYNLFMCQWWLGLRWGFIIFSPKNCMFWMLINTAECGTNKYMFQLMYIWRYYSVKSNWLILFKKSMQTVCL